MHYKKLAILILIASSFTQLYASCSIEKIEQFIKTESLKSDDGFFHKLGDHFIAEFMGCHDKLEYFTHAEELEKVIKHAAQVAGATVLAIKSFAFPPMPWVGMTSVAVLQESHISVHTWPQYGYIALDIFTCGTHVHIDKAIKVLQDFFKPKRISFIKLDRGFTHIRQESTKDLS